MKNIYLYLILLTQLIGCGNSTRDRENYGDILSSPGGITLIDPSEHQGGWGRGRCLVCHHSALNLHRRSGSGIDPDALNLAIRNNGEEAYCLVCHGTNGT